MIKHTVKEGESLKKIAAKYGVTIASIVEANPKITNPDLIMVGWQLAIPTSVNGSTIVSDLNDLAEAINLLMDVIQALPEFRRVEAYLNGRND